jgi:ankyrin repeat protein
MKREIEKLKKRDKALILFSSKQPINEYSPVIVKRIIEYIQSCKVPIKVISEAHPAVAQRENPDVARLSAESYLRNIDNVKDLLKFGADIESPDREGYTPIMFASNAGDARIVKLFIESGANVNAKANDNSTPLMFASQRGFDEITKILLDAGAEINARGNHGLTALGFASQNGHLKVKKLLLKYGGAE